MKYILKKTFFSRENVDGDTDGPVTKPVAWVRGDKVRMSLGKRCGCV